MPFPIVAAIEAGTALASSFGGNAMNNAQNKRAFNRQVRYNNEMYDKQRRDSLADWNMQNRYNQEYNSPAAQMQRFKEAGLNPNLIYGQQNMMPAAQVKQTDTKTVQPRVSDINIPNVMTAFQGSRQMAEQIASTRQQNLLLAAQTMKTAAEAKTAGAYAAQADELVKQSLAATESTIIKQGAETQSITQANQRAWIQQPYELAEKLARFILLQEEAKTEPQKRELINSQTKETQARIDEIKQRIVNSKLDEKLKQYEVELNQMGVQKNDNMLWRILAKMYKGWKDFIF